MSTEWGMTESELEKVVDFIGKKDNLVTGIISPTGSGKSTKLVKKIFEQNVKVFISEPTVVSAEKLYRTMGKQLGTDNVGFAAEGNVHYTNMTKVVYCTSGHLRRKFLSYFEDGRVKNNRIDFCDVLIIDEAHSGMLDYDVIMELWNYALTQGAEVPRLVLASATLGKDSTIFDELPIYEIKIKGFPVSVEYAPQDYDINSKAILTDLASTIIGKHENFPVKEDEVSKWLVFCPGSNEVDKVCELLKLARLENMIIVPAHSKLSGEEIDKIFDDPEIGQRMVIVATNMVEASLTIEKLDGVFDSLLEKIEETSQSGGSRLALHHISKSSADQRKGRTGRTNPGFCYRMCTQHGYMKLKDQREREIFRVPLIKVVIEMMDIGIEPTDIFTGKILDKKVKSTLKSLKELGMIDKKKQVTDKGHFSSKFPLSVACSALIYEWSILTKRDGTKYPIFPIIVLAALIDCFGPSPFFYPKKEIYQTDSEYKAITDTYYSKHFTKYEGDSDLETLLKLWNDVCSVFQTVKPNKQELSKWCIKKSLNNKKLSEIFSVVKQCVSQLRRADYEVELGFFSEKNVLDVATPILENVFKNNLFMYQAKSKSYYNAESKEYYKVNTRAVLNPTLSMKNRYPMKIVALSTTELPNKGGGPPTRIISLYQGV
jgi:HrpA-like RNA helicase